MKARFKKNGYQKTNFFNFNTKAQKKTRKSFCQCKSHKQIRTSQTIKKSKVIPLEKELTNTPHQSIECYANLRKTTAAENSAIIEKIPSNPPEKRGDTIT